MIEKELNLWAEGDMKGVLGVIREPLVSMDFVGDKRSCVFDVGASLELEGGFFKLVAWYDNEWAYANRLLDLAKHVA